MSNAYVAEGVGEGTAGQVNKITFTPQAGANSNISAVGPIAYNDNSTFWQNNFAYSKYALSQGIHSADQADNKMADLTREEVQAKIEVAEARADTKIARIEGKLDLVLQAVEGSRSEARDNRRAVISNAWVIFGALIVVLATMVTILPTFLDMGFRWRETITKEVQERIPETNPPKNAK
jgi:hypothetical protein